MNIFKLSKILCTTTAVLFLLSGFAFAEEWLPGSGKLYVSPPSTKVGIGTTTPSEPLEVNGNIETNGGYLRINRPDTTGGWARGSRYYPTGGGSTELGGIGMYGNGTTVHRLFLTHGDNPWISTSGIHIKNNGYVGIGTTSPDKKLHVSGGQLLVNSSTTDTVAIFESTDANSQIALKDSSNSAYIRGTGGEIAFFPNGGAAERLRINNAGYVGIGTASPQSRLDIRGGSQTGATIIAGNTGGPPNAERIQFFSEGNQMAEIKSYTSDSLSGDLAFYTSDNGNVGRRVTIQPNGYVGINTFDPQSRLAVNGTITTKEVEVTESGWSDFVFQDDYDLLPLDKVESYIRQNKHLPDIPSEREVKEKGLAVSGMLTKQMQKIEELTLYLIQLKKENEALRGRVAALEEANGPQARR
jgi:hypothetical protein